MKLAILILLSQGCIFITDQEFDERAGQGDGGSDGGAGGDGGCEAATWWTDADGDGLGDADLPVEACEQPDGTVGNDDDCDDGNAAVGGEVVRYADADGDGYGDAGSALGSCEHPDGYVADSSDCDDRDASVNPGATERCSTAADDDCNGSTDAVGAEECTDWFADADGDGWGSGVAVCRCEGDVGHPAEVDGDCDDTDAGVNPGADEVCFDGVDNDCDGGPNDCALGGTETLAGDLGSALSGSEDDAALGVVVARIGDVDGDGRRDFAVGANGASGGAAGSGELYLFTELPDSEIDLPMGGPAVQGAEAGDKLGRAVADTGDVDGDGYDDLLVGAPSVDGSRADNGAAYLVLGPVTGPVSVDAVAQLTVVGSAGYDYLGRALAAVGALSSGPELALGASGEDTGGNRAGAIYLFYATSSGVLDPGDAFATVVGSRNNASLGRELVAVGDADGDGRVDLLAGEPGASLTEPTAGAAYLFTGLLSGSTSWADADLVLTGVASGDGAGSAVGAAGDVDGDGRSDLMIGAVGVDSAASAAGATYLIEGSYGGTVSLDEAIGILLGVAADDASGTAVAGDGDVDDDGHADVVVGAPAAEGGGADSGVAYVLYGPITGVVSLGDADVVLLGPAAGDAAGSSVAIIDDLTGDGTDEVLVGAPVADPGGSSSGSAWLVLGGGL